MSNSLPRHESVRPTYDFRPQIENAILNSLTYAERRKLSNEEAAKKFKHQPDDYVIDISHTPKANEVSVTDSEAYPILLKQAFLALYNGLDLTKEQLELIDTIVNHELLHGAVAQDFGNGLVTSFYGVAFFVKNGGKITFTPIHYSEGPLKKIHHAWVVLAPDDRSDVDLNIAAGLGYDPSDLEAIKIAAQTEPLIERMDYFKCCRENLIKAIGDTSLQSA